MSDGPVHEAAGTTVPTSEPGELATPEPAPALPTDTDPTPDEADTEVFVGRPGLVRPVLFRLHFFGGFFAAPIALWLALTGVLFAWHPQIESRIFGDERNATAEGDMVELSRQVDAAVETYPDDVVVDITPADEPGEATAVLMQPADAAAGEFGAAPGQFTAYVDPVDARVTGTIDESRRPDEWIRNLHSNFRLGDRVGTLTELAASWVLVSLLTGLYLWWPKTSRALRRTFSPRVRGLRGGPRRQWKDLHSSIGVITLAVIAVMVVTGLTWSEYAGRWVDVTKDAVSAEPVSLDTELDGGEAAGGGGHHEGGSGGESDEPAADLDDVDQVASAATAADLSYPFTIIPAEESGQAWTVEEIDNRWPLESSSIAVDPADGEVIDRTEFGDQATIDQLTSIGIGFHEASLFGLFNQVFLTLLAVALAVMLFSGYVMWWKRRPAGSFGPPPKFGPIWRNLNIWVVLGFVALMVLLPTMGVSFLIFLVVERLLWLARRGSRGTPSAPPSAPSAPSTPTAV